jgi:hypothetical protein
MRIIITNAIGAVLVSTFRPPCDRPDRGDGNTMLLDNRSG